MHDRFRYLELIILKNCNKHKNIASKFNIEDMMRK